MAEPVAFVASIVSLVQLADRVTELSKVIVDATKDAPPFLRMLHSEASTMRDVLNELKNLHDGPDALKSAAIRTTTEQPIKNCQTSAQQLEAELSKLSLTPNHTQTAPSKRQQIQRSLAWAAGGQERIKKLAADMITQKATLSLAVLADIS